jgi:hypothetical protein
MGSLSVFLSWSGEPSHRIASILRDWLPSVVPSVEPWISSEDIEKGARWSAEIASQLDSTDFGIICVVPSNLREPWLNFEAGAISKSLERARVAPLLAGVAKSDVPGPLSQFQMTALEKEDMRRLVHALNRQTSSPLPEDRLNRTFDLCWPGLESKVAEVDLAQQAQQAGQHSKTPSNDLSDPYRQIMILIAQHGNYELDAEAVARATGQTSTRAEHYLDQLVARGLLHDALSTIEPTRYGLTEKGRALLVELDLV